MDSGGVKRAGQTKNPLPKQRVSTATIFGCCRYIRRRSVFEIFTVFRLYDKRAMRHPQ
jgi:hypothetical protein